MAGESPSNSNGDEKCRIAEILQHNCFPTTDRFGRDAVHCTPIPRLFRICPNGPAVEVTRVVDIDLATGFVEIPKALGQKLPKGKAWRDVVKHDPSFEAE
ncbi:hypothetical protein B0H17DRAFT_949535 [Mycena rosella]|uniref:Uncharacterized protein n=1 Tax=Mycena rosella TaxID=1033263 RepID=A0AAD7G5C5_MYCRO|nr:hypothetical protein B0H17DRAFT_949535 [Mycena rosella]